MEGPIVKLNSILRRAENTQQDDPRWSNPTGLTHDGKRDIKALIIEYRAYVRAMIQIDGDHHRAEEALQQIEQRRIETRTAMETICKEIGDILRNEGIMPQ